MVRTALIGVRLTGSDDLIDRLSVLLLRMENSNLLKPGAMHLSLLYIGLMFYCALSLFKQNK